MRAGELLALTLNDIDFKNNQISINKTFYHLTGRDTIQPPKTAKGERTVNIPDFLTDEIKEYIKHLYKPDPNDRLFPKQLNYIRSAFNIRVKRSGVKKIRIHDLRHSHATIFYCFHPFYLVSSLFFLIYKLFLSRLRFIFLMK